MRKLFVPMAVLLIASTCFVIAKDPPKPARPTPLAKPPVQQAVRTSEPDGEIVQARAAKVPTVDGVAKQVSQTLIDAYKKGDAKAFAGLFTADGEYIDDKGVVFHGRKAIEDEFAAFFRETPGTTIEMDLTATRSIAKGVIASDGATRFQKSEKSAVVAGRCHLVCVLENDNWRIASLHEDEAEAQVKQTSHHDQVSQIEWMIGDWIGEGPHSHVHFSCRWDPSGNYLLRDFSIQIGAEKAVEGSQRIGYDPTTGQLKIWIFDAAGGYSDGTIHREGDSWIQRTTGVTATGLTAATAVSFTQVDANRITTELIDRSVGGVRAGGVEKLTIVRKPPESVNRTAAAGR